MSVVFSFPKAAAFGRVIAKSKIYENASPSTKVKELFVSQIENITWSYKLSSETINLQASDGVQEIQVFTIELRTSTLSHDVLQIIDKVIPSPILFVLKFNGKTRYTTAFKRPSEVDNSKWVVSSYFETNWLNDSQEKTELPVVLNMGGLYKAILKGIITLPFRMEESLVQLVERVDQLHLKEREVFKIETRMKKEKQFNRKVELNRKLNELKQEITDLKS